MGLLEFIYINFFEILEKTLEHIYLSLTAITLACMIGMPIGIYISNKKKISDIIINIANIIQTIPSLALFAFAMPIFGIGKASAIFAIFLYALLPIIKNTVIGIQSTDNDIVKAAIGMGMSEQQIMFKVKIPLAVAVIMSGVRIATVTCIGMTTIATLIAGGGLGDFIYRGLAIYNHEMILTGAIFSAGLALIADYCLGRLQKKLTSKGLVNEEVV